MAIQTYTSKKINMNDTHVFLPIPHSIDVNDFEVSTCSFLFFCDINQFQIFFAFAVMMIIMDDDDGRSKNKY
jgi:hypothetical protein